MKKIELIDFLRGFAIFTIILMHLLQGFQIPSVINKALSFGGVGVHVFFLCSGFGLYLSYLKRPLGYLEFLKKRFLKIYWPYFICVLLWGIWLFVSQGEFQFTNVLSHIFLYKMFGHDLDVSICNHYWFISTIIQFYFCWPLIVSLMNKKYGFQISVGISLLWSAIVGVLGFEDYRPWGSCFLQYLWEFCFGMLLARKLYVNEIKDIFDSKKWSWIWLFSIFFICMILTGTMGWLGGVLKLYNDIPSLFAYLSMALIVYKFSFEYINKTFIWTNTFSYELYLVHSLVYALIIYSLSSVLPSYIIIPICIVSVFALAYLYEKLLRKTRLK